MDGRMDGSLCSTSVGEARRHRDSMSIILLSRDFMAALSACSIHPQLPFHIIKLCISFLPCLLFPLTSQNPRPLDNRKETHDEEYI